MLPDRTSQLLTAYVDGELSARQHRAVSRVLRRSEAARRFVEQLQSDAARLKALPRRPAPDLAESVLQSMAERPLPPVVVLPARARTRPTPAWVRVAVAAAVLLVGGGVAYLALAPRAENGGPSAGLAERRPTVEKRLPDKPGSALVRRENPPDPVEPVAPPVKEPERELVVDLPDPKFEIFPEEPASKAAMVVSLRELDLELPKRQLLSELGRDRAYRIELGSPDGPAAVERLQAALKAQGVRLLIDQAALDRLARRLRTNYVLYAENVTPEEVERVLRQVSREDKTDPKKKGDGLLERAVLSRLKPADHAELAKLLGEDLSRQEPRPTGPLGVDVRKPLSEQTAEQVKRALEGQGTPRPEPGKPVAKGPERLAILLPYNPVRPRPASSKEVKVFLDGRQDVRPGTVQVLLVLRGSKS
jgi:hypothetical protein